MNAKLNSLSLMAPGKHIQRLYGNSAQPRHGSNEFRPRLSGHKKYRKVALISLFESPAAVLYLPEISYPNAMESNHLCTVTLVIAC